MKNMSFRKKITMFLTGYMVIGLLVFGTFSFFYTKSGSEEKVIEFLNAQNSSLVQYSNYWINSQKNRIEKKSKELSHLAVTPDVLRAELVRLGKLGSIEAYSGIEDGGAYASSSGWNPELSEYDPRKRPWYVQAKSAQKTIVTDVYQDAKHFHEESYLYNLLQNVELSEDAQVVLDMATKLLKDSFKYRILVHDDNPEYCLNAWDAGWYQIKKVLSVYMVDELKEFVVVYKQFEERMRTGVYTFEFLPK